MSVSTLPPPVFDPAAAFPEIAQWRAAVRAGDWPAVIHIVGALPDPTAVNVAVRQMGEIEGAERLFADAANTTGGTLARLLLASRHIEIGWAIRTGLRAKYISREQFDLFHDHLRTAERLLIDLTAQEPDNAVAWCLRLITARGLEVGKSEARRRYQRVARFHPHFLPAQSQLLQQLCPKWSGTWEEMHGFASECALAAPPGAPNAVLVADGHIERVLDVGEKKGGEYLRQPEIFAELVDAADRSVLHPAFRRTYGYYNAHNSFAYVFSLAGAYDRAAVHFRAIGGFATKLPWTYSGDAPGEFVKQRSAALGKG